MSVMNSHMLLGKEKIVQICIVFSAPIGLVELNISEKFSFQPVTIFSLSKGSMIYLVHYVLQLF
jgi:hypothetical protein